MRKKKQLNESQPQDQQQQEDQVSNDEQKQTPSKNSEDNNNCDNSAKTIPVAKLPDKLVTNKIIINVSDTQYPVIEQVAEELGWVVQKVEGNGDWDVWWTDRQIFPDILYRMNLHQKINHFPGINNLARKNLLALNLSSMQQKYPHQFNFFPETWTIPLQFPQFRQHFVSQSNKQIPATYIVKPEAMSQGRGIFLTRNIEQILNGRKYVIQKYIDQPLLIEGLKFDLRIYVLLKSVYPLEIYIYDQGLVRLATQKYQKVNDTNIHKAFMHLTNYSLNKKNPFYKKNAMIQVLRQYLNRQEGEIPQKKQQIKINQPNNQPKIDFMEKNDLTMSEQLPTNLATSQPQSTLSANVNIKVQSEDDSEEMESLDEEQLQMIEIGHKRSLSSLWQHLSRQEKLSQQQIDHLKQNIEDVIIKTIISGFPAIQHQYKYCQPELPQDTNMCFHILGVDVMLVYEQQKIKPIVLQINHTPSFETSSEFDYKIKKNLIVDTLKIMDITQKNKKRLFKKGKEINRRRLETGKREPVQSKANKKQEQVAKEIPLQTNLGGYKKIFPLSALTHDDQNFRRKIEERQQMYLKLINYASIVHKETSEVRNKLIKQQQDRHKNKNRDQKFPSKEQKNKNNLFKKSDNEVKDRGILQKNIEQCKTANFRTKKILTTYSHQAQKQKINKKRQNQEQKIPINNKTVTNNLYDIYEGHLVLTEEENILSNNSSGNKSRSSLACKQHQLIRFSQVMMKLVMKQQKSSQNKYQISSQQAINMLKHKKTQITNKNMGGYSNLHQKNIPQISQGAGRNNIGAFLIPKIYEIADSRNNKKQIEAVSSPYCNNVNLNLAANSPNTTNNNGKIREFNDLLTSIEYKSKSKIDPKILKNLEKQTVLTAYKKKKRYSIV